MTAIHLGPHPVQPARLYDLPEPRFRLTPRLMGAATAVALVYAAGGMMLNLAGIEFSIPIFQEPPAITVEYDPPEITITPPKPAAAPVETQTQVAQPQPNTFMDNPTMTPNPAADTVELPPASALPEPGPVVTTTEAAPPPPPAPVPAVIRNPSWVTRPTAAQLARLYPDRAAERGVRGAVTMECRVAAQGSVNGCVVLRESPTGYGFGEAALASTRYFRLNPRTIDGQAIEGARVHIPMGFNLAD